MKAVECSAYFREQEDGLARTYPPWAAFLPAGDLASALTTFDEATEKGADRAARIFARTGKWPSMGMEVGTMIRMRLAWAAEFLGGLEYARRVLGLVNFGEELEKKRLVRMMLVDAWDAAGFASIVETIEHLQLPGIGGAGLQALDGIHPDMN